MATPSKIGLSFGLLLAVAAPAQAQSPDICAMSAQAATSAAQLRDSGKPKTELEKSLPGREVALTTPTGTAIYQTLDDVYSFTDVGPFAHYYYRVYTCLLKGEGKPVPASFGLVNSAFIACQEAHGTVASDKLGLCLMQAVNATAASPQGL